MIDVAVILFILAVASFSNNVISAFLKSKNIDLIKSTCYLNENHKIKILDNIPILSFILLKGKCRTCEGKIPIRFLLVEITTILTGVPLYLMEGFSILFLTRFLFLTVLIWIAVVDIYFFRIPNKLLLVLFGLLIFEFVFFNNIMLINIAFGGLVAAILLLLRQYYLLRKNKDILGMGDLKLIIILFVLMPAEISLFALWGASVLGIIFTLINIKISKVGFNQKLPFAPFLNISFGICLIFQDYLIMQYYKLLY
ncbi:MAG: prepilin peptidase [bacterium]